MNQNSGGLELENEADLENALALLKQNPKLIKVLVNYFAQNPKFIFDFAKQCDSQLLYYTTKSEFIKAARAVLEKEARVLVKEASEAKSRENKAAALNKASEADSQKAKDCK